MPKIEAAKTFGVGISSVKRYMATYHEGRSLAPKKRPGSKPKLDEGARGSFWRRTSRSTRRRPCPRGASSCGACMWSFGERLHGFQDAQADGVEQKKRSVGASERDEFLRAAWRALVAGGLEVERLVFVDEMGANTSLAPLYAWSRRGARALASAPRNWGANVTLLASA
jgi:hypothetical protein